MATRYIANTPAEQKRMLETIGSGSIEDLLSRIPTKARLSRPLSVPVAMAESDLVRHLRRMGRDPGVPHVEKLVGVPIS